MTLALGLESGDPFHLGGRYDGRGVNFAVYALNAESVELCLFDRNGQRELARLPLPGWHAGVWHGYLPGAQPGLIYGYRVHGPWWPERGLRYNAAKLLCDPYARRLWGRYQGQSDYCDHLPDDPRRPDPRDNAVQAVKSVVTTDGFDWGDDAPPRVPWADTLIYELHVKGFSRLHPDLPPALRGTYAGLARPVCLDWLRWLGVTTLELLPVAAIGDEGRLLGLGLSNYWGYNPLAMMTVEPRYAAGSDPLSEFKSLVRACHAAGLEVILDVVCNHTAEGGIGGPSFHLRGLDQPSYYRLRPDGQCENWSGTGNTLDLSQPRCLQLVLDTLRFWAGQCRVDGFRFDLAPVLGRGTDGAFDPRSGLLAAIQADPLLGRLKLIAEPWDLGPDGYRVGGFPPGWAEWNDRYRDGMRRFWLRREVSRGEFARRLCASSELFERRGRCPWATVNLLTAHDGFTLRDLTSYRHKHNEANGEDNRDGHSENFSDNCGVEGSSDEAAVNARRGRLQRALLTTLLCSQGTPMLLAGDEIGHSQRGNNNAYCQDNRTSWLDWDRADQQLAAFVARLAALRRRYRALRFDDWFSAGSHGGYERPDVEWRDAEGRLMTPAEWDHPQRFVLEVELAPEGEQDVCLLLVNAEPQPALFTLRPGRWLRLLDSADPEAGEALFQHQAEVEAQTVWLLVLEMGGRVTW
ncbi:glycogen debranching protein GlgX [Chitinimonas lacunae]|uniref:Glycogen debranching protein GlgX n=1 Tax=Chitinimonas lacunae TaxID=1963018 RepID=A0ABV8MSS1_9NEIS